MEINPVFTADLDVSRGSSYGGFISDVREQLVLHTGATRHLDLVLLRPQEEDPRRAPWFGVTLRRSSSGDSVLLRIRADNLYISGYYESPAGRWWEFQGVSVIDAATQLAFTDSYGSMEKAAGLALERVALSKEELEAAVGQLARSKPNAGGSQQQGIARSLMAIAVMVCEAIRFRSVAGVVAHVVMSKSNGGERLPAHMVEQVKNWGSLSEYWLGAALYGQPFLPHIEAAYASQQCGGHIPQHLLAPVVIDCQDHAMMALGVVLNQQRPLQDKHKKALDEHWCAVRAQARKLDRKRT